MRGLCKSIAAPAICAVLTIAVATSFAGAPPAGDDSWRKAPVTSHLKNFVVADVPRDIALNLAIWAENLRERIELWVGESVPGPVVYPLVIDAEIRTNEPQGFVILSQGITDDGHLRQGMTIVNRDKVDGEDLLDGLCHLLLNRWIMARQAAHGSRIESAHFPRWFSCGVAQSLFPGLVERNREVMVREEQTGRYLSAISAVSRVTLPPGRWPEKAHAGLVVSWMADHLSPGQLVDAAAGQAAEGRPLDKNFVLNLMNFVDEETFNASWDLWMAERSSRIVPGRGAADTSEISRILELHARDLGLKHPAVSVDGSVSPILLIDERNQDWAREVCRMTARKLHKAMIGKLPPIREAVEPYLEVLDLMLNPPPVVKRRVNGREKVVSRPPSTRIIHRMWKDAEREWRKLTSRYTERKLYVDQYDIDDAATRSEVSELLNRWEAKQ